MSVQNVYCACGIRITLVPRCSLCVHDVLGAILSWRSCCHCHCCWRPAVRWRCTKWAFILKWLDARLKWWTRLSRYACSYHQVKICKPQRVVQPWPDWPEQFLWSRTEGGVVGVVVPHCSSSSGMYLKTLSCSLTILSVLAYGHRI